jgi:hypothetical protein
MQKYQRDSAHRVQASASRHKRFSWEDCSNDALLDQRFCDLGVTLKSTWVEGCVEKLYDELERRGLHLRPHVWLSREWFSPDGIPGIAIPFYLAHPRLTRLERKQMLEVEGGSRKECMKILRHERGHALMHAYRFHRRRRWQELFGKSSRPYPDAYRPNPASRRYVQHLRLYYAQSHPDEDFAETFAVWFQSRTLWRNRYADWPALKKLEYVGELMTELKGVPPPVHAHTQIEPLPALTQTLRAHYAEKRKLYQVNYTDIYDRDLLRLFSADLRHQSNELASTFLRRNRAHIRRLVSRWTGEYQFTLDQVLNDMIGRCRQLKLRTVGSEQKLRMDFAVLLTVQTMHFLYSRKKLYFLEANPNPEIAEREEFASAAQAAGLQYPDLLQRILQLGLNRKG